MCERLVGGHLRMRHPDGRDEYVTWKYKDLPRPPTRAPCKKTLTLKDIVRDCEKPKPSGSSRIIGQDTVTRLMDNMFPTAEDWDDPNDPYNNTATGFLGTRRKSMLSNRLLVKHKVGTSFRYLRNLPCDDFTYGSLPISGDMAAHALRGWGVDSEKKAVPYKRKLPKLTNFLALNRAAVTAGICREDDWRDFRNTHRLRFGKTEALNSETGVPPVLLNPDMEFGRRTNYNSSAAEIMSGQEQKDWLRYVKICNIHHAPDEKIDPWKENHAYSARMFKKQTDLKPEIPWHMPKFERKAKPHLSTFRKASDEIIAYNANNLEKVGRDGMFGQGITTKSCNRTDALRVIKP